MTDLQLSSPTSSPPIEFGVDRLVDALRDAGSTVERHATGADVDADVRVAIEESASETHRKKCKSAFASCRGC